MHNQTRVTANEDSQDREYPKEGEIGGPLPARSSKRVRFVP
jgi:hypothetical protein